MTQPAPLRILISGAGIAGPALALCLIRFGVEAEITIVERHHELRANGQQIDLRGQGLEAMKRMGIEAKVREQVVDERGLVLVNRKGERAVVFGKENSEQKRNKSKQQRQGLSAEWEIMRGDLCRILYNETAARPGVTYRFGVGIQSFDSAIDSVHVQFTDGTDGEYDLVVGADGVGSKVRKLMFGAEDKHNLRFFNLFGAFYTIPPADDDTPEAVVCMLPNRRNILTRKDREDCLRVYLGFRGHDETLSEALKGGTVEDQKKAWAKAFDDEKSTWQIRRFLDGLNSKEASDFYAQEVVQIRADVWSQGRVTLLGDAGYCPTPITGMGTSLAVAGAYVLAGEIAQRCRGKDDAKNIPAALKAYEDTFRPFVRDVQNLPIKWLLRVFVPRSIWAIRLLIWIVLMAKILRVDKLLKLIAPDDDTGSWRLPDYEQGVMEGV